jgi:3-hydroxy-9,10-secoandrosta-1,3,5(10)-triene-9,17-dione monooxygenase
MTTVAHVQAGAGTQPEVSTALLEPVRAIVPELRERSEATAAQRRVPEANARALQASGALRTIQSTRNGGFGASLRDHLNVVATLGEGCGSTAWCAGVIQAHSWLLSHFPTEAQDEVYGDPDTIVAAVVGPRGRAVRTADGYRLSGTWPFASGNEISTWVLLGAVVVDEAGNRLDEGELLVPLSAVTRLDDWFTTGLAGTGSCSVTVSDLAVPAHRFLSMPELTMGGAGPGTAAQQGWNHRCPPVPVLAIALTGSAIGIARQALAEFPSLIAGRRAPYAAVDTIDHPVIQVQVGDAAMRIHEGELVLYRCADDIDRAGRAGETLDLRTRARMRLDCAQGVHRCLQGVELLFRAAGTAGIRSSSSLARAVNDLRTINQHAMLNLETSQEIFGRVVLGLDPGTPLL